MKTITRALTGLALIAANVTGTSIAKGNEALNNLVTESHNGAVVETKPGFNLSPEATAYYALLGQVNGAFGRRLMLRREHLPDYVRFNPDGTTAIPIDDDPERVKMSFVNANGQPDNLLVYKGSAWFGVCRGDEVLIVTPRHGLTTEGLYDVKVFRESRTSTTFEWNGNTYECPIVEENIGNPRLLRSGLLSPQNLEINKESVGYLIPLYTRKRPNESTNTEWNNSNLEQPIPPYITSSYRISEIPPELVAGRKVENTELKTIKETLERAERFDRHYPGVVEDALQAAMRSMVVGQPLLSARLREPIPMCNDGHTPNMAHVTVKSLLGGLSYLRGQECYNRTN